jgi:predicted Zn-dependent peptidase
LPTVADIIQNPTFPEEELEKQKKNNIQKLAQDKSKNELLAYRLLTEQLYGPDHPYGYNTEISLINEINPEDLIAFYNNGFGTDNCFIVLAGKFGKKELDLVRNYLGHEVKKTKAIEFEKINALSPTSIVYNTKNDLQSSIKIGVRMFNRHHPDYTKFHILNTIFGGYFGSRLMKVIREDLGYTYNIYSILDYMIYDGYFYIATDVSPENVDVTIAEIAKQMDILKQKKVSSSELNMVKNYLMGSTLNLIDGPLNTSNLIKSLVLDDCLNGQFDQTIHEIQNITPDIILDTAQRYLDLNTMTKVIVGA